MALDLSSTGPAASMGSFYNDMPSSPGSSNASVGPAEAIHSSSAAPAPNQPSSPYPNQVEPSPVESTRTTSTDATDIDEEEQDHARTPASLLAASQNSALERPSTARQNAHEQAAVNDGSQEPPKDTPVAYEEPRPMKASRTKPDIVSATLPSRKDSMTSPLNTNVPVVNAADRFITPKAQTRQEAEYEWLARVRPGQSLEGISESPSAPAEISPQSQSPRRDQVRYLGAFAAAHAAQIDALTAALSECWTLCTTLASLSSERRSILFGRDGNGSVQEQAWRTCWALCQDLYDKRDADHEDMILPTLELCRDFCQPLFEARRKQDEASDSVLRVSFELNNHLYNTHEGLPSAFRQRTLDFYLTICHRLMKQRTALPFETDALLRACWTLAELLYSVRQSKARDGAVDEELLGSAVQACWELCDQFREGWSQIRPGPSTDRASSRSVQSAIPPSRSSARRSPGARSPQSSPSMHMSASSRSHHDIRPFPPETPTTIFDDNTEYPLDSTDDVQVPNILVLGPGQSTGSAFTSSSEHWPSSASSVSEISEVSHQTGSTTMAARLSSVAVNLARIRVLMLQAAAKLGFQAQWVSPRPNGAVPSWSVQTRAQSEALGTFVRALTADAFGELSWQRELLDRFRRLVHAWPSVVRSGAASLQGLASAPTIQKSDDTPDDMPTSAVVAPPLQIRATPAEVATAVRWMMRSASNIYLGDLFRFVHGYVLDDAAVGIGHAESG